ncbi:MAG: ribonuclease HII [Clostridia bacterium]|nr:ribonuclease HII [Clostridia bacterium]
MADKINMLEYEYKYYDKGYELIAGVDEAGRGPLAGPVFAAAVVFDKDTVIPEINDSKKLTEKKREELFDVIIEKALYYNIVSVSEQEIDRINILNAALKCFNLAVSGLDKLPDIALIDGNRCGEMPVECETIVKGDAKSMSIAAASILAKVARDRYITELDSKYPEYNFKKHKGYGTKEHLEAIAKYGPCSIHRMTFKGVREHVR